MNPEKMSVAPGGCIRTGFPSEHPYMSPVDPKETFPFTREPYNSTQDPYSIPFPDERFAQTAVYVSGPLTAGVMTSNIVRAADVASVLLDRGYAVYLPHTNVVWEIAQPRWGGAWLAHDFEWVRRCDVLLRLAGASRGADMEVQWAVSLGKNVYTSIDLLVACEPNRRRLAGSR